MHTLLSASIRQITIFAYHCRTPGKFSKAYHRMYLALWSIFLGTSIARVRSSNKDDSQALKNKVPLARIFILSFESPICCPLNPTNVKIIS